MAGELVGTFGTSISEFTLVPSKGGVFTVNVDGRQLFSKKEIGRFPEEGEILRLIQERS